MSHADRTEAATALTRRRLMLTSAAATATTALMPRGALATVQVQITQGNVQAMPIAIPDFLAGPGAEGDMPRNITQIITSNLIAQRFVRADRSGGLPREDHQQ